MVIFFDEGNHEGVINLHDNNALVVTILVANFTTKKIIIDNGSLIDILFWEAFTKMGID